MWGRWRRYHTFSTHRYTHMETDMGAHMYTRVQGSKDTQEHLTGTHRDAWTHGAQT